MKLAASATMDAKFCLQACHPRIAGTISPLRGGVAQTGRPIYSPARPKVQHIDKARSVELLGHATQTLLEDGELVLYRSQFERDGGPVLLLAPRYDDVSSATLARIEHEFTLSDHLDITFAAKPLELGQHAGRTVMVLRDPGGVPLARMLQGPMQIGRFLQIAVGLANALQHVHSRGLVHRDVRPANVLVDATGFVWLTGFGLSFHRSQGAPKLETIDPNCLAYMAPEQFGRAGVDVEATSDLYSLGIVLYEMLTGQLPFSASGAMEWSHAHSARAPAPPRERIASVPLPVDGIVLKLLAKRKEERYRTIEGAAFDLQQCLDALESGESIASFPLATRDLPTIPRMPNRLYGRSVETKLLIDAFDRISQGGAEMHLIFGQAGIGKSSLVNELQTTVLNGAGFFAGGKSEQSGNESPFASIAAACRGLVRQLLGRGPEEMELWRRRLLEALGPNGWLVTSLVPDLELLIGDQDAVSEVPPKDARARFDSVFRRFLGAFACREHPLVLFLDDLQWLDVAAFSLIESLFVEPLDHFMLVGACRDNENDQSSPLQQIVQTLTTAGSSVHRIALQPLTADEVSAWVTESLRLEPEIAQSLAQPIVNKTQGNPFFVSQFLNALIDEDHLYFDPKVARWAVDLEGIRSKAYTDNVVDIVVDRIKRLPEASGNVLAQLAFMGHAADAETLAVVCSSSVSSIEAALSHAEEAGLVVRLNGTYAFLHDRVQDAATLLIVADERAAAHLKIGWLLYNHSSLSERIFEVVGHFERAKTLLKSSADRRLVASLNLTAAKRAKVSSAFQSARQYCLAGLALLVPGDRQKRPRFELNLHLAECEYVLGDLESSARRLKILARQARLPSDAAAITKLQLDLHLIMDRSDVAVAIGLDYLRRYDNELSPHPSDDDVRLVFDQLQRQLRDSTSGTLIDLPAMSDDKALGTMDVLASLISPAQFMDVNLFRLVVARMVQLSIEHGNADGSSIAYAELGGQLRTYMDNAEACRYLGKVALDLVERRGAERLRGRVYLVFALHVGHWLSHLSTCRSYLRQSFKDTHQGGDLTWATFARVDLVTNLLASGEPLGNVEDEAVSALGYAQRAGFGLIGDVIDAQLTLIRTLRSGEERPAIGSNGQPDEATVERHFARSPQLAVAAARHWIRKVQARFFLGDFDEARRAADQAEALLWTVPSQVELPQFHLYAALARARCHDHAPHEQREKLLLAVKEHHRLIALWADVCPENFSHCAALVGAELARIEGRDLEALRKYEEAVRYARQHRFVQIEALASERAADLAERLGLETTATLHLRNAHLGYVTWQAVGKARQLERAYPTLLKPSVTASKSASGLTSSQFDVAAVIRMSQTISEEIVLDRLIQRLMTVALEYAGAARGLLLLPRDAELRIVAEATTNPGGISIEVHEGLDPAGMLATFIMHEVGRTHEMICLDNAVGAREFAHDPYIAINRLLSVICVPLVNQGRLVGILYLENSLATAAFSADQRYVLALLASQAAISLENARLYQNIRTVREDIARSESILSEAQRLSKMGSWSGKAGEDELVLSRECARIFGLEDTATIPYPELRAFIHPDDLGFVSEVYSMQLGSDDSGERGHRIIRPDGKTRFVQSRRRKFADESGSISYVGTVMDVTEQRDQQIESRRLEEALHDAQATLAHVGRLTAMGELTVSIAHEINQPLSAIVTNAQACIGWLERANEERATRAAKRIIADGHRAGEIVNNIRAMAKKSPTLMSIVNLNEAIAEVLQLMRGQLRRNRVNIQSALASEGQEVLCDRVQMQQVIMNLLLNAIEAMVLTGIRDDERNILISSLVIEMDTLQISVADTGPGIREDKADQIFEAFFTTKPTGLGIGLSVCRSILQAHKGRLWTSRNKPRGSVFHFALPLAGNSEL